MSAAENGRPMPHTMMMMMMMMMMLMMMMMKTCIHMPHTAPHESL
jgi:hypothetical protein